jgi:hypothetical protein
VKEKPGLVYLDTYVLQKDMRIRLPKEIIHNLNIQKGTTFFDIYLDSVKKEIVLKVKVD